jgi:hypothetical protein
MFGARLGVIGRTHSMGCRELFCVLSGQRRAAPRGPPRCRGGLTESARYPTMEISPDANDLDEPSIVIEVVYCAKAGITFDVFR